MIETNDDMQSEIIYDDLEKGEKSNITWLFQYIHQEILLNLSTIK